jgi:release factor glutamine methyltransferase
MYSMWGRAEGRKLGRELRDVGVPVMVLKGPELQERLYGTPAAYQSSDIDVLVRPRDARRARQTLHANDWTFEPENGVLWWLSAAASFERQGFRADLHWGLHAAHLPAWALHELERAMWERARTTPSGFLIPDDESLFVFLAVHAVGHGFERREWVDNVHAAAERVGDWQRVWAIARRAHVTNTVRVAMSEQPPGIRIPVLDGPVGRAVWWSTYLLRGHTLPRKLRERLRESVGMHRRGFGIVGLRGTRKVRVGDLSLVIDRGVFDPRDVTLQAVDLAERLMADDAPGVVVDIGTGSGAVAIAAARRWPSADIHGSDVSFRAVGCAQRNAIRLGVNASFHVGNLLTPIPSTLRGRVDLAFSNVPYVSPAGGRKVEGWDVPMETIFGPDVDGLGLMRDLMSELPRYLRPGAVWVFQVADAQLESVATELSNSGFEPLVPKSRRTGRAAIAAARWGGSIR